MGTLLIQHVVQINIKPYLMLLSTLPLDYLTSMSVHFCTERIPKKTVAILRPVEKLGIHLNDSPAHLQRRQNVFYLLACVLEMKPFIDSGS